MQYTNSKLARNFYFLRSLEAVNFLLVKIYTG